MESNKFFFFVAHFKGQMPKTRFGLVILGIGFVAVFGVWGAEGKRDIPGTNSSHPARLRHPKKESSSFSNHPFSGVNSLFHENFKDIFPNATPENKACFKGLSTTIVLY